MNNKKYREHLRNIVRPIKVKDLPKVKIDLKGMMTYADSQGKSASKLSRDWKLAFIKEQSI